MLEWENHRTEFQEDIESSLQDILCILQSGVSGTESARIALSITQHYFSIDRQQRIFASLDPRIVSCVEGIQRLFASVGDLALSHPYWKVKSNLILRLDLYRMLVTKGTGHFKLDIGDDLISIPGTSLNLAVDESHGISVTNGTIEGQSWSVNDSCSSRTTIARYEEAFEPPIDRKILLDLSAAERMKWERDVADALNLALHHSQSYELIRDYVWFVVPIADEQEGVQSSISFSSLPHAVYTSRHDRPEMLAETLVHEADHQWLYSLSRTQLIWESPEYLQYPAYRSPWRDDPRPLGGLLRGASAFVRVGRMWAELQAVLPPTHSSIRWVRERAFITNFQALDALRVVTASGGLSSFGCTLVGNLVNTCLETRDLLKDVPSAHTYLQRAFNVQSQHDEKWRENNQKLIRNSFELSVSDYVSFDWKAPDLHKF